MQFCVIRLGKDSVKEIHKLTEHFLVGEVDIRIHVECKQVPKEIEHGTFVFLWLGSDNNKGTPTKWKQGLRAFGVVIQKLGGPNYNDPWEVSVNVRFVFEESLTHLDLIELSASRFLQIADIPVLGIQSHSNQTIQTIRIQNTTQDIETLVSTICKRDPQFYYFFLKISEQNVAARVRTILELDNNLNARLTSDSSKPESINSDIDAVDNLEVEIEHDDSESWKLPFDPRTINIDFKQLTLQHIFERFEYDEINFDTDFQREFVWSVKKQSLLIESILLSLPLPTFYFDATNDNKWDIVDGMQRVSTLKRFVSEGTLKLEGLEFLKHLNGETYFTLSRELQRSIKSFEISTAIIKKGTPPEVKYNIFKRINTGGLTLTPQEIRHALNSGGPAVFVANLAKSDSFRRATAYSIRANRMLDRDFVTRFLSFFLLSFSKYEPDLDSFLTKGMAEIRFLSEQRKDQIFDDFMQSMDLSFELWGRDAFRRLTNPMDKRKPLNKALFEVISVSFALLDSSERDRIRKRKADFVLRVRKLMENPPFLTSITQGTGSKEAVITRYQQFKEIIEEFLR